MVAFEKKRKSFRNRGGKKDEGKKRFLFFGKFVFWADSLHLFFSSFLKFYLLFFKSPLLIFPKRIEERKLNRRSFSFFPPHVAPALSLRNFKMQQEGFFSLFTDFDVFHLRKLFGKKNKQKIQYAESNNIRHVETCFFGCCCFFFLVRKLNSLLPLCFFLLFFFTTRNLFLSYIPYPSFFFLYSCCFLLVVFFWRSWLITH